MSEILSFHGIKYMSKNIYKKIENQFQIIIQN